MNVISDLAGSMLVIFLLLFVPVFRCYRSGTSWSQPDKVPGSQFECSITFHQIGEKYFSLDSSGARKDILSFYHGLLSFLLSFLLPSFSLPSFLVLLMYCLLCSLLLCFVFLSLVFFFYFLNCSFISLLLSIFFLFLFLKLVVRTAACLHYYRCTANNHFL